MAFKLQGCIVANFFIKFKATPYHCLRNVPQMGQAEGKEGQMLFTINVKGYTSVLAWDPEATVGLQAAVLPNWKKNTTCRIPV